MITWMHSLDHLTTDSHSVQYTLYGVQSFGNCVIFENGVRCEFFSAEAYLNITHTPTENEFAEYEAEDPFMEDFIATLDRHLATFEPLLVPVNYQV